MIPSHWASFSAIFWPIFFSQSTFLLLAHDVIHSTRSCALLLNSCWSAGTSEQNRNFPRVTVCVLCGAELKLWSRSRVVHLRRMRLFPYTTIHVVYDWGQLGVDACWRECVTPTPASNSQSARRSRWQGPALEYGPGSAKVSRQPTRTHARAALPSILCNINACKGYNR